MVTTPVSLEAVSDTDPSFERCPVEPGAGLRVPARRNFSPVRWSAPASRKGARAARATAAAPHARAYPPTARDTV
ncbi:hypothetical protein GCM10018793_22710 [Streptomyces sulfonofaciens]|uniref:Uncharacterized protein n=1 Tax=Streptomyces sulfonofaciens TaxID=68272 RepID=A0A919G201_9ACTN|nr:hypothetical protein GCM10018793_22710 [Streptomyces sulfonofaciens]